MSNASSNSTSHPSADAQQESIHMVDLGGLHARLRPELDRAIDEVLR